VFKWASTGARQTYSNAFRCFQGSQTRKCVVSVFLGVSSLLQARRFSFLVCAYLQQQRHHHHCQDVRLYYCTAAWKPFASCFIAVPCDWLAECVRARVCTICSPSVPHFAARLACLRSACLLLATCCCCSSYTLPLRYSSTRRLSTRSLLHPASHIPDYRVGCPHPIHPSIQPDSRSLSTHSPVPPLLACLLALPLPRPASLPWRAPDLSSSFAWHTAASHSMRCSW
jgi:hypothetical protein